MDRAVPRLGLGAVPAGVGGVRGEGCTCVEWMREGGTCGEAYRGARDWERLSSDRLPARAQLTPPHTHCSDGVQTVITHFPRDISPGVKPDWVESQAIGTLNWTCHPWMDWFHGGLHFQIEHHLFPR